MEKITWRKKKGKKKSSFGEWGYGVGSAHRALLAAAGRWTGRRRTERGTSNAESPSASASPSGPGRPAALRTLPGPGTNNRSGRGRGGTGLNEGGESARPERGGHGEHGRRRAAVTEGAALPRPRSRTRRTARGHPVPTDPSFCLPRSPPKMATGALSASIGGGGKGGGGGGGRDRRMLLREGCCIERPQIDWRRLLGERTAASRDR